jgi:DNA-binding NarL/FixJ family response regulator
VPRNAVIRVLVADDDARVRRALRELIDASEEMHVVASAGDVNEALEQDARTAAAVALVDVMLPDRGDGVELVRALSLRGRPVVAMSVSAAVRKDALDAGARHFVEKAPDAQRLLTALRHSADRHLVQ